MSTPDTSDLSATNLLAHIDDARKAVLRVADSVAYLSIPESDELNRNVVKLASELHWIGEFAGDLAAAVREVTA